MKALVRRVLEGRHGVSFEEIDISHNSDLMELYELEIPVLLIDGRKAAKYRISEAELLRRLDREGA